MRKSSKAWKVASARGMAALLAVVMVLQLSPARASVGDIFSVPAPMIGSDPPKSLDLKDGDTSVASQTGAFTYSYPINVPPGRLGMAPRLALSYSSQGPVYGGIATGWNWNMSVPEIREDTSAGRIRTRYPAATLPDPRVDDRFISTLAGGRALVLVDRPEDANKPYFQYRAEADARFDRYERIKNPGMGVKWRVYSTDGSIRHFGNELQAPGCIQRSPDGLVTEDYAPLTSEVDQFGNEVSYTYESVVPHECRIKSIRWGQNINPGANLQSFAQIDFEYTSDSGCSLAASQRDFRNGFMRVSGASRLNAIKVTAFPPGGSPGSAVHTRQIALGYDAASESCTSQHAPIKVLKTITESAWGVDSPLVTLPPKTFTYNQMATTLTVPNEHTFPVWTQDPLHSRTIAWGYRRNDDRIPTVEAMYLDIDGDGLLDRVLNSPLTDGTNDENPQECRATWFKNKGAAADGSLSFEAGRTINLPRLKWRGSGTSTPAGASTASRVEWREGCSLNGQHTAFRNSIRKTNTCSDNSSCEPATDTQNTQTYCNVTSSPSKGTACPPGGAGPGTTDPDDLAFRTYLNYRWLDMNGDGLVDLVAAVNGAISVYDIEKGNNESATPNDPLTNFSLGEPSISGIPGYNEWPPCPGASSTSVCLDPGPIDGEYACGSGSCPRWDVITNALSSPSTGHVPCSRVIEKPGNTVNPNGPCDTELQPLGQCGCGVTGGCGGGGGTFNRKPYERCQGLYPWLIYFNEGAGRFSPTATVKYQPVPLESDNGDSSLAGPGIITTNHAVIDFDGDGALDAVVHPESAWGSRPGGYQVFLGDRTGQLGPTPYFFPTRPSVDSRLFMVGSTMSDMNFARSTQGLIDFNADGLPDHWKLDPNTLDSNVILHAGTQHNINQLQPSVGEISVPGTLGNDTTFTQLEAANPQTRPIYAGKTETNNRVVDVDGDGRPDVVKYLGASSLVFFNFGSALSGIGQNYPGDTAGIRRFVEATNQNPDPPEIGGPIPGIPDPMVWELKTDLVDLDGDGIAESVSWNGTQLRRGRVSAPPRLMTSINNGRGLTTNITYASMHADPSSPGTATVVQDALIIENGRPKASPTNQWVVKSITSSDTFNFGPAATTSYKYEYPVHNQDEDGRYAFRGFERVTTTKPNLSRVVQTYGYAIDWSGRLEMTVVMPGLGTGEGDNEARTIDRTDWTAKTLFDGRVTTYHARVSEHFVCADLQTEAACTTVVGSNFAAPGYTRTTSTFDPLASPTADDPRAQVWQETSTQLQSGADTADAEHDRKTTRKFKLVSDLAEYRLRALETTQLEYLSGNWTVFAKTAATWDPSYRMQLTDEEWFDNIDANRAIRRFEYEPLTGNVVNTWKPEQNAAGTTYTHVVYDERQLFPANETNELGHFREFKWEYGTGTMLETDGPNVRGCIAGQPGCHDVDADYPLKEQNKIRIDGLGRMIERYESFSGDGYVYRLHKVETNEYIETVAAGGPSIIHRQLLDIDVPTGWKQDRTDFDGFGRVIRQIVYVQGSAPADQITVYLYNADSTVSHVAVPDPTANSSATVTYVYTYDSLGRAKSIRRPDGTPQSGVDITYDGVTQTTTEVAGAGGGKIASTTTINDRFGRLSQVWEKTDESWAITHYGYDAHDLVTSVTDPQSHQTTMTHDFAGRRTSITRAGRTWSLEYDRNGNVIAESVPGAPSGLESLWINSTVYDDLDRPTSKLIGTRDLDCQSDPAFCNSLEVFTYDIDTNMKGRLRTWHAYAQSQSWNVAMNLRVDIQGRPSDTILYAQLPGLPQLSRWIYESWFASGPRQQVRHGDVMGPLFDTWTQTFLDPRGLPSWVNIYNHSDSQPTTTRTVAEQTRNVAGLVTKRRTNVTSGMGFAESNWAYDKLGRVVAQAVKKGPGSQTVASQSLAYHGADDPKQLVHCVAGSSCAYFVYNYDLRHQLTDVSVSSPLGFTGAYRYGAAGRFTSARVSQPSPTPPVGTEVKSRYVDYVYGDADPERVTALKNYGSGVRYATFTYDEAGNMISKCMGATFTPTCTGENFTYLYDGKDQLRRATRRTGGTITGSEEYWYDKDGQRIAVLKKNGSGAATELVLFLKDTEAHYNIAGNTPTLAHIFSHVGMGTPVARVKRTSDAVVATELQFHGLANNTIATVDINGTTNATFRYAPFGEIIEGVDIHGAAAHRRRFNDKQQDELTGLVYYGVRYYDKTLIGWTQSDPAYRLDPDGGWVTPRSALLYAAHRNNPLRYLDPDGRSTFANVVKVFVGAATAVEVGTFGVAVGLAAVTLIPVVAGNHTGVSTPVTHEESYDRAQLRRAAEAEERIDRANANQVLAENINDKDQNTESSATTGRATNTQQDAASPPPDPSGEPPRRRLSAKEIRAQNQATTAANKRTNKHTNVGAKDNQNQVNNPTAQELSDKAESIRGAHDENHPGKTEQRMREQLIIEGQQRGDD